MTLRFCFGRLLDLLRDRVDEDGGVGFSSSPVILFELPLPALVLITEERVRLPAEELRWRGVVLRGISINRMCVEEIKFL